MRDSLTLTKTVSKSATRVQASALDVDESAAEEGQDTPPGPATDDRAEPRLRGPVPPADTLESVADPEEPLPQ